MNTKQKEILEELTSVFSSKTIDALFPPLVFVFLNRSGSLINAIIGALLIAAGFNLYRIIKKQKSWYALFGLLGVAFAGGFAFIANNASNYFLPGIISSLFLLAITFLSIVVDKPLAAFASHLTRGWTLQWFWRDDIKPAYREVTWVWALFLTIRTILQVFLFLQDNIVQLFWVNTILGLPVTILVLIFSYVYGLWRLKQLHGPGIEEFNSNKTPPYKGQTRGF